MHAGCTPALLAVPSAWKLISERSSCDYALTRWILVSHKILLQERGGYVPTQKYEERTDWNIARE